MSKKLNLFSAHVTQVKSQGASQAMLYGTGLTATPRVGGHVSQPARGA